MASTPPPQHEWYFARDRLLSLGVLTALTALFLVTGMRNAGSICHEAVVTEGICHQLLHNTTEGRQALVGSVWWPPLPILLRLPLVGILGEFQFPFASLVLGAVCGAATLIVLAKTLRRWGFGFMHHVVVAALALNPRYLEACSNGSSDPLLLLFMVLVALSTVQWMLGHELRYLVRIAFAGAGMLLTCAETVPWLMLVFLLLSTYHRVAAWNREKRLATLILMVLPTVYVATLWFLMNWLIMGDALYFLRSLLRRKPLPHLLAGDPALLQYAEMAWPTLATVCLPVGLVKRDRSTVYMALLAIAPLSLTWFLLSRGLTWMIPALMTSLSLLAVLTLACLSRGDGRCKHPWRTTIAAVVPLILLAPGYGERLAAKGRPSGRTDFASVSAMRSELVPRLTTHVLARSPYARVFVAGYEGFALLGPEAEDLFVHSMDFNFGRARQDYHGQDLFLLVPKPRGRAATESIHWKYQDIYAFGHASTLYDSDWGEWRLFEIVQAPVYRAW
ncbi:MAG: hypothetical protein N2255_08430 [Kiritimatiellae bacterium]|nr:hypothetical protein [Kiritimatiellia bacterium]